MTARASALSARSADRVRSWGGVRSARIVRIAPTVARVVVETVGGLVCVADEVACAYASSVSEPAQFKVCPDCHDEHTLVATHCGDCGVPLVFPADIAAAEAVIANFPPASELECIRVAPVQWIRALSEGLEAAGHPHRVEPATASDAPADQQPDVFGDAQLFGLYVEAATATVARTFDAVVAAQVLPSEAPAVPDGELDECPACGAALAAADVVCPDCELQLG